MTLTQKDIIDNSPWIRKQKVHQLEILWVKYQYQIFERIFLNVSGYYAVNCKKVMQAKPADGPLYAYLCICILLIDEYLFKVFGLEENERNSLLGEWMQVLVDYYSIH